MISFVDYSILPLKALLIAIKPINLLDFLKIIMDTVAIYQPKNKIRIVTAAALFDGHDAAINIMRRIIQASGAEVIHLGHDRSAEEPFFG